MAPRSCLEGSQEELKTDIIWWPNECFDISYWLTLETAEMKPKTCLEYAVSSMSWSMMQSKCRFSLEKSIVIFWRKTLFFSMQLNIEVYWWAFLFCKIYFWRLVHTVHNIKHVILTKENRLWETWKTSNMS